MFLALWLRNDLTVGALAYATLDEALACLRDVVVYEKGAPYLLLQDYRVLATPEYFLRYYKKKYDVQLLAKWRSNNGDNK